MNKQGRANAFLWIRDKNNYWESELKNRQLPMELKDIQIDLKLAGIEGPAGKITVYDPWEDEWKKVKRTGQKILLPDFKHSLVIRISR
ncbi:MAG: hypothetical protein RBR81_10860 [Bacteroidales bacterium]|jgi:hypothetical protein|nr:hypothetical protein [Bacteroidales bacterium]